MHRVSAPGKLSVPGENRDKVVIDGIVNELTINNGAGDSKDTITIASADLIGKKLKLIISKKRAS